MTAFYLPPLSYPSMSHPFPGSEYPCWKATSLSLPDTGPYCQKVQSFLLCTFSYNPLMKKFLSHRQQFPLQACCHRIHNCPPPLYKTGRLLSFQTYCHLTYLLRLYTVSDLKQEFLFPLYRQKLPEQVWLPHYLKRQLRHLTFLLRHPASVRRIPKQKHRYLMHLSPDQILYIFHSGYRHLLKVILFLSSVWTQPLSFF